MRADDVSPAIEVAEPIDAVDEVPLEVLEHRLTTRAAELAAAEAEWMGWLADYDRRRGWAEWGCVSAAHWLSWKCGVSPSAGRERVRVATALAGLPLFRTAFEKGQLSYSKAQALTRIANKHNEPDLITLAINASGAQLAKICAAYRSTAEQDTAASHAFANRALTSRRRHDGTTTIRLDIPDDAAAIIAAHLEREVTAIIADATANTTDTITRRDLIAERGGIAALRADAAIALLTGQTGLTEPTPADVAMIIPDHADTRAQAPSQRPDPSRASADTCAHAPPDDPSPASADTCAQASSEPPPASADTCAQPPSNPPPAGTDACAQPPSEPPPASADACAQAPPDDPPASADTCAQARLPDLDVLLHDRAVAPTVGQRLLCDPRIRALIETTDGQPLAVGRRTRIINPRLRHALHRRDHGICRFPGCHATRGLHAHHITHWTNGGPTNLDNLLLLCPYHHHLVHEGGWTIDPTTDHFIQPNGTPIEQTPPHLRAGVNHIEPNTWRHGDTGPLEPPELSPFDLPWTTTILHHNETIRRHEAGLP